MPLHGMMLHFSVSDAIPGQVLPPYFGAGLVHVLVRDFLPPPQLTEQEVHFDQDDQPP